MLLYQTLAFTIYESMQKSNTNIINLKYEIQRGMINLHYITDDMLYQIFKIILSLF